MFSQYSNLTKAFYELSMGRNSTISYQSLKTVLKNWNFEVSEENFNLLFNWLDQDQDGEISYEDLRVTAGRDITPQENLFFRQDVSKGPKPIICNYNKCFENNKGNSKSHFCELH